MAQKLSFSFRMLRFFGFNYSEEEYGQVSLGRAFHRFLKYYKDSFLLRFVMNSFLLSPFLHLKVRPWVLRQLGCSVGKRVFIGDEVMVDFAHADLICIEDGVYVTGRTILLCHKRDLSDYYKGDDYAQKPYKTAKIVLKKGCSTGTGTIIMPGVTIGEGAIIGAGSLVTHDIPAWTIAMGRPAKVVREIVERNK